VRADEATVVVIGCSFPEEDAMGKIDLGWKMGDLAERVNSSEGAEFVTHVNPGSIAAEIVGVREYPDPMKNNVAPSEKRSLIVWFSLIDATEVNQEFVGKRYSDFIRLDESYGMRILSLFRCFYTDEQIAGFGESFDTDWLMNQQLVLEFADNQFLSKKTGETVLNSRIVRFHPADKWAEIGGASAPTPAPTPAPKPLASKPQQAQSPDFEASFAPSPASKPAGVTAAKKALPNVGAQKRVAKLLAPDDELPIS